MAAAEFGQGEKSSLSNHFSFYCIIYVKVWCEKNVFSENIWCEDRIEYYTEIRCIILQLQGNIIHLGIIIWWIDLNWRNQRFVNLEILETKNGFSLSINSFVRTFLICENLLKRRIFKSYKQENLGKLLFTNWTWFNCEINWWEKIYFIIRFNTIS